MSIPFASQHTPSFPAVLQHLGAAVLASTYQAGQLIILRAQNEVLNTHFCALEKPMGLALHGERLAVGSGYQLWEYWNLPAVADKVAGEVQHDACFLPRSLHITGDIDIHEMAYTEESELWLVNTRMSCLCTLDPAYSVVPRWRPPFVSGYDLTDRCHLNGLALKNGQPAYVTALGRTDSAGGWRANKANGGIVMALPDGRVVAEGLSMPHSPRFYRDRLWCLESGAGSLCTLDPKTGAKTVVAQMPGFTRGLDFVGRYAFIGLSQVRETAVFSGLPLTAQAGERHCGVWVIDIETGAMVACVIFTGSVQEIFAVQVLPYRFPVLLDPDDPLLRVSYSLPDAALAQLAAPDPLALALEKALQQYHEGQLEAAIASYRHILAQTPDHVPARYHLGRALADAQHWKEAEEAFLHIVARQPGHAEAHNSLGQCFVAQHDWNQALLHYEKALAADRQFAVAHLNRAILLLKLGRYAEGWEEYEWRLQLPGFTRFACPQPRWQGEAIADKVLLVYTEQDDSETLQFARFLPLAAQRCKKLLLACPETLRSLLATAEGVTEARVPDAVALDSFDYICPLPSLPHVCGATLDNLPPATPYLRVPAYVSVPLLNAAKPLRIGIYWGGSEASQGCPLQEWTPLFAIPEAAFYSLQTHVSGSDTALLAEQRITDLSAELTDYARCAAFIAQLDLVITVDSAIAHLAGALHKPVWLLLTNNGAWPWLLDRNDCPWYASMRLFRQKSDGDWLELLTRARDALIERTVS